MDLGCPLLRGSFVRRLRRRAATDMSKLNDNKSKIFSLYDATEVILHVVDTVLVLPILEIVENELI